MHVIVGIASYNEADSIAGVVRVTDQGLHLLAREFPELRALIQATACKLWHLHAKNLDFRQYSRPLLMENKFRAVRYGLDGKMIDFGKQIEVPARELILEYLAFIDDVLDELGSRHEISYIHTMLERGSGADRQLKVFRETGDLKAVVDYMVSETRAGL